MDLSDKKYTKDSIAIRKAWVNLLRPIKSNAKNPFLRIDFVTYLMLAVFIATVLMYDNDISFYGAPFIIGFLFSATSRIYFKLFPLSWEEMLEGEKIAYRRTMKLPRDWEPTENKI